MRHPPCPWLDTFARRTAAMLFTCEVPCRPTIEPSTSLITCCRAPLDEKSGLVAQIIDQSDRGGLCGGYLKKMGYTRYACLLSTIVAVGLPPLGVSPGVAGADDACPDVEVVFARGTDEPPGVGRVGQALVDTLRPMLGDRSIGVYAVNYPASINFLATGSGATDADVHLAAAATACPATKFVLGGFSQGAAVMSMLAGVPPLGNLVGNFGSAPPLPQEAADQISAVTVFGNPGARFGTPLSTTGLFAGNAIDLCSDGDPICFPGGRDRAAHNVYEFPPYITDAAAFIASRV